MRSQQIYRAPWHDYRCRCIYMITVNKRDATPPFAFVDGSELKITAIGREIRKQIIRFPELEERIRILQYVVMPDHVHILLFATAPLPEKLGYYIARWKIRVNEACGIPSVFENGFNDQILRRSRSLKVLVDYIRDNPRRLIVRKQHPDFFRRVNDVVVGGRLWHAYGNVQLLDNPFREQVVVHRADGEAERAACRERWLYCAANGGVLVSPFISRDEKEIRALAEECGGKTILIRNEPLGERFKPAATDFDRCLEGRLLILAPPDDSMRQLTRPVCMQLNSTAASIAAD